MQTKQQIMQVLLPKAQSQHKWKHKLKNPQTFNYERNKHQIIQQLLASSQKTQPVDTRISEPSKLATYYTHTQENKIQIVSKVRSKEGSKELLEKEFSQKIYFNDYFLQNKSKQKKVKIRKENVSVPQLIAEQAYSLTNVDNSEEIKFHLLDFFTKKDHHAEKVSLKISEESQNEIKKFENKSFQNQSTLAVSKLAKSPHRALRKTQNKMELKSDLSNQSKKSKSPHLTISKVSAIQIRVDSQNQVKPQLFETKSKNKSGSKQNLSYSSSIIHLTGNQFDLPSEFKPKTPPKSNYVLQSFQISTSRPQPYNLSKSPPINIHKKASAEKKSEIKISVIKQNSSQEIQTKNFEQRILNEFDQQEEKLFDSLNSKKGNLIMQQFSPIDHRKVAKINDQIKFKRQIQEERQMKKEKQLARSLKNRQKAEKINIFNGCPTLVFQKNQNKPFKTQIQQPQQTNKPFSVKQKDQNQDQQANQQPQKLTFFDFLKGKITSLTQNDKQVIKQNKKAISQQKLNKQSNQFESLRKDDHSDSSMKAQLSEASSSNSFFKQKKIIEQKGIRNVDLREVVDQSVKNVSLNLQKAEENLRKSRDQNKINERSSLIKYNQQYKKPLSYKSQLPQQQKVKPLKNDQRLVSENGKIASAVAVMVKTQQPKDQKTKQQKVQTQKITFAKIFGIDSGLKQKQKKDKLISVNRQDKQISEFFAAQGFKNNKFSNISQPSTVQKNQERSVEKSDFLNQINFEEVKDSEFVGSLFQKADQPKIEQAKKQESFENVLNQLNQEMDIQKDLDQSKLRFQTSIKESVKKSEKGQRQININLMNLKQVSLSFDALSFSKLQNFSERQCNNDPTLNSFKITTNLKQIPKELDIIEQVNVSPKEVKAEIEMNSSGKKGKVQRIQINIDDSDQQSDDEQLKKATSDSELDIDDIQDYKSDSDEQTSNQKQQHHSLNERQKISLTPIIEEDLQQSQLNKYQHANIKRPSKISGGALSSSQIKTQSVKELEKQLLKDFKMDKSESGYSNAGSHKQQKKSVKVIRTITKKVSLVKNLSEPEQSSISSQSILSSKEVNKTQKELIDSIKGGIEGLKQKISSVVFSDTSKYEKKNCEKSQLHSEVKHISIDLDDEFQKFQENDSKSQSNVLAKMMKQKSSSLGAVNTSNKLQKQSNKNINFDQLDLSVEQDLYNQFKQTFLSLKKKVEDDHRNY